MSCWPFSNTTSSLHNALFCLATQLLSSIIRVRPDSMAAGILAIANTHTCGHTKLAFAVWVLIAGWLWPFFTVILAIISQTLAKDNVNRGSRCSGGRAHKHSHTNARRYTLVHVCDGSLRWVINSAIDYMWLLSAGWDLEDLNTSATMYRVSCVVLKPHITNCSYTL